MTPAEHDRARAGWRRFYARLWVLREATGETWPAGWYEACEAARSGPEMAVRQLVLFEDVA